MYTNIHTYIYTYRALPLIHTISRNKTITSILNESKYKHIRIHGIAGNMNPDQPWITSEDAAKPCFDAPETCPLFQYSSTCWYYAQSLSEFLKDRPIGMIHTSFGGSTIEQWLDNTTISTCRNATLDQSNGQWHEARVVPYLEMVMKGWIWYQGENGKERYSLPHTPNSRILTTHTQICMVCLVTPHLVTVTDV